MAKIKTIILLIRRSLRQHALSTVVTAGSVALGAGLVMAVFAIQQQSQQAFVGGPIGFDAIVGARGSALQLVLNTVFHLETSPGNIPWSIYQDLKRDPKVALAIPYAVGDNWYGYRIVGTTPELFTVSTCMSGWIGWITRLASQKIPPTFAPTIIPLSLASLA